MNILTALSAYSPLPVAAAYPAIAIAAKHSEKTYLRFCTGCLACQKTQRCVQADDAPDLVRRMHDADAIAFATPIYYYEMSGQMKTLLDRMNPLFSSEYAFREVYLLAASADGEESAMDGAVKGMQGWVDCFEKARFCGVLRGTGLTQPGEAPEKAELCREAYRMGQAV